MSREETDRVRFLDSQFDYTRNIAYRLSHEAHHFLDAVARRQNTPAMQALDQATQGIRRSYNGQCGLSALGSMGLYQSQSVDVMAGEDRTELMTMYAWSPDYFNRFTQFLSDPTFEDERRRVGLATIRPTERQALYDITASVVHDTISHSR